ncbi:MAG TPA: Vps62-related protein [Croceibacterium sp.]
MTASEQRGDLLIATTSNYQRRWDDHGSKADRDVALWHPKPDGEFRPLGSLAVDHYSTVNRLSALLANAPGKSALAAPVGYTRVWDDTGGSAERDVSIWRPVAPEGYVALGDVAVPGYNQPSVKDVWCVRADLTERGAFGSPVWDDRGARHRQNVSIWPVKADDRVADGQSDTFAQYTFISNAAHDSPGTGLAYVLLG